MEASQLQMKLIINNDLGMGKGKIAAQVGHTVSAITLHCFTKDPHQWKQYVAQGSAKIVLKASGETIQALAARKHAFVTHDAGRTQIEAGSLTCVGFLPTTALDPLLNTLKLL